MSSNCIVSFVDSLRLSTAFSSGTGAASAVNKQNAFIHNCYDHLHLTPGHALLTQQMHNVGTTFFSTSDFDGKFLMIPDYTLCFSLCLYV